MLDQFKEIKKVTSFFLRPRKNILKISGFFLDRNV